jgi:hypothetical protein
MPYWPEQKLVLQDQTKTTYGAESVLERESLESFFSSLQPTSDNNVIVKIKTLCVNDRKS